jgi:hypothetical protein
LVRWNRAKSFPLGAEQFYGGLGYRRQHDQLRTEYDVAAQRDRPSPHVAFSKLGLTESDDAATRIVAKKVIELVTEASAMKIATLAALNT